MPVLFNKPQAVLTAPGMDSPEFRVNQVMNSMEIRVTKVSWPANAQVRAWLEYSPDDGTTWIPGGEVTDDGTRTKDMFIRCDVQPPFPSGYLWKAHVTVNQNLNVGVVITVT